MLGINTVPCKGELERDMGLLGRPVFMLVVKKALLQR